MPALPGAPAARQKISPRPGYGQKVGSEQTFNTKAQNWGQIRHLTKKRGQNKHVG
jgi:hypothetical protein